MLLKTVKICQTPNPWYILLKEVSHRFTLKYQPASRYLTIVDLYYSECGTCCLCPRNFTQTPPPLPGSLPRMLDSVYTIGIGSWVLGGGVGWRRGCSERSPSNFLLPLRGFPKKKKLSLTGKMILTLYDVSWYIGDHLQHYLHVCPPLPVNSKSGPDAPVQPPDRGLI